AGRWSDRDAPGGRGRGPGRGSSIGAPADYHIASPGRVPSAITFADVTKRFRTRAQGFYVAVRDLTFEVARGEFCAIVGPTGSGKSTTLNLIAGLERPSRGQVVVLGEVVTDGARGVGYMFETHDLEEAIALADRVLVFTAAPATVKQSYRIALPRPRNVAEVRFDPRFTQLYERIWEDLRDEAVIAYERSLKAIRS